VILPYAFTARPGSRPLHSTTRLRWYTAVKRIKLSFWHVDGTIERQNAQSSQQTLKLSVIGRKIDQIYTIVAQLAQSDEQTKAPPPPTLLLESCDTYMSTIQTIQGSGNEHAIYQSASSRNILSHMVCSCPKKVRRCLPPPSQRWFSAFRINESKHLPGCLLAVPSQKSVIVGLRLRACWGALGYLVDANLEWSHRSLSPKIVSRNLIDGHSNPAFFLMRAFGRYVEQYVCGPKNSGEIPFEHAVTKVVESVGKLLRENRIGVLDVDSRGSSVLHVRGP
jgi:hypothetical protein